MVSVRNSADRGRVNLGWLDSRHSFSFGHYYDPDHMGYHSLRVINEDRVQPGKGFDTHSHKDMEIISYVLEGSLEHRDSMGNGSVIRPGDVQRMTAGSGISHSEFNGSNDDPVHFLQIWVLPETAGLEPGYEQKHFATTDGEPLTLIASRDGREGSVTVHQDVDLYRVSLSADQKERYFLAASRHAWLQVARGALTVNGRAVEAGDGLALDGEQAIDIQAAVDAEALLFDLA